MKIRPQVKPASKGADEGWAVLSTLISGMVLFGGIGWLLDHWWDTRVMVPVGLVVGITLGIYAVVAQFGRPQTMRTASDEARSRAARSTDAAMALRAEKALNRARASHARTATAPNDGPPPASIRRETECL